VIDVPHDDKKVQKTNIDLGTTEIHIDEQGNLLTNQEIKRATETPLNLPPEQMVVGAAQIPTAAAPPPPPPPPPAAPLQSSSTPEVGPTVAESLEPVDYLPPPPPAPPIITHAKSATPPPWFETPKPEVKVPEPVEEPTHHTFLGNTAQPAGLGIPVANSGQPDWAAPYDLVPMDPLNNASSSTSSEFGSTPVAVNPEATQNNFGQGHTMGPPGQQAARPTPVAEPVDNARTAVEQAIAAAPFDPAFGPPVQALNSQPISQQPINHEAPPTAPNIPALPTSDTPMLVLPTDNSSSVTATQPIATQSDYVSGVAPAAPPPLPPPLMTAPGAIVPNVPPAQQR
jgi:hypothetical protein